MKTKFYWVITITLIFFAAPISAQYQLFAKHGSHGNDYGQSIAIDAADNKYCTGAFDDSIFPPGNMLISSGNSDCFISCHASNGAVTWTKKFGGVGDDGGYDVALYGGHLYVTGYFSGPAMIGTTTLSSAGGIDIFLLELDPIDGAVINAKSFGSSGDEVAASLAVDSYGVHLTGAANDTFSFGSSSVSNIGAYDGLIAMTDLSCNPLWARSFGGSNIDQGCSISTDASGNSYITGFFNANSPTGMGNATFGSASLTADSLADGFLAKYDVNGNFVVVRPIHGLSDDSPVAVSVCGAYLYLAGFASTGATDFVGHTLMVTESQTGYVAQYDLSCTSQWVASIGAYSACMDVIATSTGAIVCGTFRDTSVIGMTTIQSVGGSRDAFLADIDQNGNCQWAAAGGGNSNEDANGIALNQNGAAYFIGSFRSTSVTFGQYVAVNANTQGASYDMYFVKYAIPTGIAETNVSTIAINAFPNPFTDRLTVPLPDDQSCMVIITDMSGREVERTESERVRSVVIDCGNLPSGMYLLSVRDEQQGLIGTAKVIKQ